jgi:peptide/nickel transport system permease protein
VSDHRSSSATRLGARSPIIAAERAAVISAGSVPTLTRRALRKFVRHRLAMFGVGVLVVILVVAVFAPVFTRYDYGEQDLASFRLPPSAAHILGTDSFGRDVWSRLLYGGRVSMEVGILAVGMYELIAILLGAVAGYYGGAVDMILMRTVDIVLCFPTLMIIIFMVAILGPSLQNTIIVIGLLGWTGPTRLVRGQILSIREMDYVLAARSLGVPDWRIIFRHVLPGVFPPLIVHATFGVAGAILLEAGLSFLNLGIRPPTPSWGNMLSDAQQLVILEQMPWLWLPPGLAIMLTVLSINFIGDGLRDAIDPRQRAA